MSIWGHPTAAEQLENRVAQLETICDSLQRAEKKLDLEFTELYDKVSHTMSRMARRQQRAAKENGELVEVTEPDDGLDPISRSILRRRGMPRVQP